VHDPAIANLYYQEGSPATTRAGTALSVEPNARPAQIALAACRPNPSFGPTTFQYSLGAEAADVELAIFDITGRSVRTLVSGPVHVGTHQAVWDGRDDNGRLNRAGVYYYRLRSGGETRSRLLVLTH
jgi:flagellar hook assembly protein FlgD